MSRSVWVRGWVGFSNFKLLYKHALALLMQHAKGSTHALVIPNDAYLAEAPL